MSEVHRYNVVKMLSQEGNSISYAPHGPEVVLASAFDNATRLFLDAAERCLAAERREEALQLRLNTADQRIDELVSSEVGLREELALLTQTTETLINAKGDALLRLTAAERRNAAFQDAATDVISNLGEHCCSLESQYVVDYITEQLDKLAVLTKPAESGASE